MANFTSNGAEKLLCISPRYRFECLDHRQRINLLIVFEIREKVVTVGVQAEGHVVDVGGTFIH